MLNNFNLYNSMDPNEWMPSLFGSVEEKKLNQMLNLLKM